MAHAFASSPGYGPLHPLTMELTASPSVIGFWSVMRTRRVLLTTLPHSLGNTIMLTHDAPIFRPFALVFHSLEAGLS